ncbi:MAG: efflux family protein [Haloplasmataceae bacterium]|nr:efflux family protein [Haloplasmataceae bacterium]
MNLFFKKDSDYTLEGKNIRKDVLIIALPVLVELLLGSLFGMVDMMMLGKMKDTAVATASVASVGFTNQPLLIGLSFIQALNVGATAMVSRYLGSNQRDRIEPTLKHVLILSVFMLAIPLSIFGFIFSDQILKFMGAEPDVVIIGRSYFRIIMIGFIFQSINMAISATLRGIGETKIPMYINLSVNLLNVFGNFILIYGYLGVPPLGITGAAISTAFSNMIATILLFSYIIKGNGIVKLNFKHRFKFDTNIVYNLVRIGVPASVEQLVLRLGILIFVKIVGGLGTVAIATHQIALSILGLSFQPGQAFGIAASALIGRSLGKKDLAIAEDYGKETRRIGTLISTFMALIFFFFGKYIVALYTNDQAIIDGASLVLKIIAIVQPFQSSQLILVGGLRGAGDTVWPLVSTFIGVLGFRVGLAIVFVNLLGLGLVGAWYAVFSDQFVRWLLVYFRFKTGKWKYIKLR